MGAYLPGFKGGGPVTSVKNLVDRLSDEIEFKVVAPDRDLFSTDAYAGIPVREWTVLGKEKVLYLPPSLINILDVLVVLRLTRYDVIYLNSFFSPRYTIPVLLLRRFKLFRDKPVVLAVRGEFSPAALNLKSRKKQIYLQLARRFGLLNDVLFHATNAVEEDQIRTILGSKTRTHLAPPLTKSSGTAKDNFKPRKGPIRVVFLGRIAPMKNLDYALKVLAEVQVPVDFTVYGPLEDEQYWAVCQDLMTKLPDYVNVEYVGSIHPSEVPAVLALFDLFFLPTRGENFGHVIAEALAAGCPVLISDQTPWIDLEPNGCGWALSLESKEGFSKLINAFGNLPDKAKIEMRVKASEYANRKNQDHELTTDNLNLFRVI